MQKLYRVLFILMMVMFPMMLYSQFNNNTTSPFSRFGLGDLQAYSFGRTTAMGGATIGSRYSNQINISNPASYTSLDSLSFLFEFGLNGKFANYKNDIASLSTNDINFRYFSMAFRINDWMATSLTLAPYSDVGYDVEVNQKVGTAGNVKYNYFGEGSLSRSFIGLAIEPFRNFSVGTNFYYFFGTLSRTSNVVFPEAIDSYSLQQYEQIRVRDFGFNFGLQFTKPLNSGQSLTLGFTIENKPKTTALNSNITQKFLSSSQATDVDTISYVDEKKDIIRMPLSYGVGLTYSKLNQIEINLDYFHQSWSKAEFFGSKDPLLNNFSRFALGVEYLPEKFSIRSTFKRIAYRAGIKYEKSYLLLNDKPLYDFGISFGVGLPVYRSNSTINVSAEMGKRGRTSVNLIREDYFKFNLAVNLYDLWFTKRRFD